MAEADKPKSDLPEDLTDLSSAELESLLKQKRLEAARIDQISLLDDPNSENAKEKIKLGDQIAALEKQLPATRTHEENKAAREALRLRLKATFPTDPGKVAGEPAIATGESPATSTSPEDQPAAVLSPELEDLLAGLPDIPVPAGDTSAEAIDIDSLGLAPEAPAEAAPTPTSLPEGDLIPPLPITPSDPRAPSPEPVPESTPEPQPDRSADIKQFESDVEQEYDQLLGICADGELLLQDAFDAVDRTDSIALARSISQLRSHLHTRREVARGLMSRIDANRNAGITSPILKTKRELINNLYRDADTVFTPELDRLIKKQGELGEPSGPAEATPEPEEAEMSPARERWQTALDKAQKALEKVSDGLEEEGREIRLALTTASPAKKVELIEDQAAMYNRAERAFKEQAATLLPFHRDSEPEIAEEVRVEYLRVNQEAGIFRRRANNLLLQAFAAWQEIEEGSFRSKNPTPEDNAKWNEITSRAQELVKYMDSYSYGTILRNVKEIKGEIRWLRHKMTVRNMKEGVEAAASKALDMPVLGPLWTKIGEDFRKIPPTHRIALAGMCIGLSLAGSAAVAAGSPLGAAIATAGWAGSTILKIGGAASLSFLLNSLSQKRHARQAAEKGGALTEDEVRSNKQSEALWGVAGAAFVLTGAAGSIMRWVGHETGADVWAHDKLAATYNWASHLFDSTPHAPTLPPGAHVQVGPTVGPAAGSITATHSQSMPGMGPTTGTTGSTGAHITSATTHTFEDDFPASRAPSGPTTVASAPTQVASAPAGAPTGITSTAETAGTTPRPNIPDVADVERARLKFATYNPTPRTIEEVRAHLPTAASEGPTPRLDGEHFESSMPEAPRPTSTGIRLAEPEPVRGGGASPTTPETAPGRPSAVTPPVEGAGKMPAVAPEAAHASGPAPEAPAGHLERSIVGPKDNTWNYLRENISHDHAAPIPKADLETVTANVVKSFRNFEHNPRALAKALGNLNPKLLSELGLNTKSSYVEVLHKLGFEGTHPRLEHILDGSHAPNTKAMIEIAGGKSKIDEWLHHAAKVHSEPTATHHSSATTIEAHDSDRVIEHSKVPAALPPEQPIAKPVFEAPIRLSPEADRIYQETIRGLNLTSKISKGMFGDKVNWEVLQKLPASRLIGEATGKGTPTDQLGSILKRLASTTRLTPEARETTEHFMKRAIAKAVELKQVLRR